METFLSCSFGYIRVISHLKCKIVKMERFLSRKEKSELSIVMFIMEMPKTPWNLSQHQPKGKYRQSRDQVDLEGSQDRKTGTNSGLAWWRVSTVLW